MKELVLPAEAHIAITKTVTAERKRLFDFIRQRVRNEADAEDLLQDVFTQFASNYSLTEPIEQVTAWLFTVARNKIIDWYRKKRPETLPASSEDASAPLNLEDILFDPKDDPEQAYLRSTVWRELADALDDMPAPQRKVFIWHELEGKSFKEMADLTGDSVNTLLSRKRYAVLFLRERLQELYEDMVRS